VGAYSLRVLLSTKKTNVDSNTIESAIFVTESEMCCLTSCSSTRWKTHRNDCFRSAKM